MSSTYATNTVYVAPTGTSSAVVTAIGGGGGGNSILMSNASNQWSTTLSASSATISGNLYVSGQIYQNYTGNLVPDYTREWAMMTMIKLTKAEKDILDLKQYINLLEIKLDKRKAE